MKLREVKEINKHTNNIEILKLAYKGVMESYKITDLYQKLKDMGNELIPQDTMDKIVHAYIQSSNKAIFAHLLANENFIDILKTVSDERLERYLAIIHSLELEISHPQTIEPIPTKREAKAKKFTDILLFLLTDKDIIAYYYANQLDLIDIFEDCLKRENQEILVGMIKEAAIKQFTVPAIKLLVEGFKECDRLAKKNSILRFVDVCPRGCELKYEDISGIINSIKKDNNGLLKEFFVDSNRTCQIVGFSFIQELIDYVTDKEYSKHSIIFDKTILKFRKKEEIKEMLDYMNQYPIRADFFEDSCLIQYMSWEEQKDLFDSYDLKENDNYANFNRIINNIILSIENYSPESQIPSLLDNLYTSIKVELDKEQYKTTVEDYLNTCATIQEVLDGIEALHLNNANFELKEDGVIVALRPKNNN